MLGGLLGGQPGGATGQAPRPGLVRCSTSTATEMPLTTSCGWLARHCGNHVTMNGTAVTRLFAVAILGSVHDWLRSSQQPNLGYDDTPLQPDGKWRVHDVRRPAPESVVPGPFVSAPPPKGCGHSARGWCRSVWLANRRRRAGALDDGSGSSSNRKRHDSNESGVRRHPAARGVRDTVDRGGNSQDRGNSGVFLSGSRDPGAG